MTNPAAPRHRRWINRPVTREIDRHGTRWLWGLSLGVFVALVPAALYQLQQNECLQLSYRVSALRSERDRLIEQERRLVVRRDSLESLETIESWALTRRGMIRPEADDRIVVSEAASGAAEQLVALERGDRARAKRRDDLGGPDARRD